jgi:DNA-binding LacI/PurR family transcriptional regulator
LIVGKNLSVIGFDDAPMTAYLRPALTTLHQPIAEIGAALVTMLDEAIKGNEPPERHILMQPKLVLRYSCWDAPKD